MFKDRIDAGIQLAESLQHFKDEDVIVLAIPRGGLPLGAIVAKKLNAPLDVVLSKKIGHPYHKEYAIGAVSLENIVLTDARGATKSYIKEEIARIRKKLKQRYDLFYEKKSPKSLKNKVVIIVDDGIATGSTILATAELVRQKNPKKVIVAIPVAPASAIKKLENNPNLDEVVCLEIPYDFQAVGQFYIDFPQLTDQQAIQWLEKSNKEK